MCKRRAKFSEQRAEGWPWLTSWCQPAAWWGHRWRFCYCPVGTVEKTCHPCPSFPEHLWTLAWKHVPTKPMTESQLKYVRHHFGIKGDLALCLTWPPRRRAFWSDPGADMSVWRLWALSELSAIPQTKKLHFRQSCWWLEWQNNSKQVRGKPCSRQRFWCTARRSAWCHSVAPSRPVPPGRYLRGGWSLKKYP